MRIMKRNMKVLLSGFTFLVVTLVFMAGTVSSVYACFFTASRQETRTDTRFVPNHGTATETLADRPTPAAVWHETVRFRFTHGGQLPFSHRITTLPWSFVNQTPNGRNYSRQAPLLFMGTIGNNVCPGRYTR